MNRVGTKASLAAHILAARLRSGLSQQATARRARLDPGYLSRIEHGKIRPSIEMALRIADALGLTLGELFERTPARKRDGPCPVSASGRCLNDLLDSGSEPNLERELERYSPRQVRLLRKFTAVLARGRPEVLKAFETLIDELLDE